MNIYSIDYAKQKMQEIIERVIIDDACRARLVDALHKRDKIFPLKGILQEMQSCNKLPYLKEEIDMLNDLTAIYI